MTGRDSEKIKGLIRIQTLKREKVFVFLPVYYYLLSYAVAQIAMILNELET